MSAASSTHEVVVTRSGARAMLDHASGEIMHPAGGPLIESERLYVAPSRIAARLQNDARDPLVVLDVGLGAGSNAAAAWRIADQLAAARRLEIVSFDRHLAALGLALQPEHSTAFGFDADTARAAHELLGQGWCERPHVRWRLRLGDLVTELAAEPTASADVVFWDPFSPRTDPALWSVAAFSALRRVCRNGATVHTYSGATATRTALLLAGFAVGFGPSAGDKQKHTTIAALDRADLAQPLDRRWLERLTRSTAGWPSDATPDALARISRAAQFAGA